MEATPMKSLASFSLLAAASCLVSWLHAADDKAVDQELAKFKGTWKVVSYEEDGEKTDEDGIKAMPTLTFDGRNYTWSDGEKGKIKAIDPTKKPKTIDYTSTDKNGKEKTDLAIYELDGDSFKDCMAAPGKERPKEFAAKKGTGNILITYKRVK
jgi:uncharacterized protein (TIGR03067 family)